MGSSNRWSNKQCLGIAFKWALSLGRIGWTGKLGEQALKSLGGESQVAINTTQGLRVIDQVVKGIAK